MSSNIPLPGQQQAAPAPTIMSGNIPLPGQQQTAPAPTATMSGNIPLPGQQQTATAPTATMSGNIPPPGQQQAAPAPTVMNLAPPMPYHPPPMPFHPPHMQYQPRLQLLHPDNISNVAALYVHGARNLMPAANFARSCHAFANPGVANPTPNNLVQRVTEAQTNLGARYDQFHQDASNAVALRMLAPVAGPNYGFVATNLTLSNGVIQTVLQCQAPGCSFHGQDRDRHMQAAHVRDIAIAFCCPYEGCRKIVYRSDQSNVNPHLGVHRRKNHNLSP
ncbi:hypothetical protein diail_2032 [Diaporthe ilicicola]|nr:hypothetical protein diail_2032 [Diaporthe ilicicola]